jgi:hypothetical protein
MKITVTELVLDFKDKKIQNTKVNEHAISDYLKKTLGIKTYIPFRDKRRVVEMVAAQNITEVNGVKKNDVINQYISFVCAMLTLHTDLSFSDDPIADYDLLAECGLLPQIIAEFQESYSECDVLLKMAVAAELEDNNINVLIGKFLNGISNKLDDIGEIFKSTDIKELLGANFNQEDLNKLSSFLDTYNK